MLVVLVLRTLSSLLEGHVTVLLRDVKPGWQAFPLTPMLFVLRVGDVIAILGEGVWFVPTGMSL